ncbi:MAG: Fe-S protein assembly chaperone HscA [Rickettsiales bacterium]
MSLIQIYEPGQTPIPHSDVAAVGIDLGTTHSVVAVAGDGNAEIIHNIHGHALVPSVVYYAPDGSVEVGYSAKARADRGERNVISSIKRLMGRGVSDIKKILDNSPYDVVENNSGMVRIRAGGRELTPVEISADILKHLKANAEKAIGKEVTKAVITVPAYFDDAARTATKDAAKLAGLEVLRLVNEPTAAALAYGLDNGVEGIYAIYDLGGGTFDISLLKLEQGVFQVLATGGDTALGGDDFDQAVAAWILGEVKNTKSLASEEVGVLVAVAREAKHKLTDENKVDINYGGKTVYLSRADFEDIIYPYVEKTIKVCEQALEDANLTISDIKGIVMVGGSTRVPLVFKEVQKFFNKEPLTDVNPDEVVAIGAALQAQGLTEGSNNLLLDVIPLSLGLETMGGITEKLIYRNTPIPVSVAQEFTTYQDGQDGMKIHVVQGEREMVSDNRSLANFELTGIPQLPAGIARINVTFAVDADGLLTVSAEEKTTGKKQIINVKPSYGIEPEQMEKMLLESMENAKRDITERLLIEARVDANRSIIELNSALKQDADLLLEGEWRRIERQVAVLRNAIDGEDRDYIDAELQELGRIAQPFAERRMDRAINSALKGTKV